MSNECLSPCFHPQEMETVESVRYGLWYMLMMRNQGHLAHAMIGGGFRVIEFLRRLHRPLPGLDTEGTIQWVCIRDMFCADLLRVRSCLKESRVADGIITRLDRTYNMLISLGVCQGGTCTPPGMPSGVRENLQVESRLPCGVAPLQTAAESSPASTSPASNTGSVSPPVPEQPSGESARNTCPVTSESMDSAEFRKASSEANRYRKGTGHPKRPNPYTKKGGKVRD